MIETDNKKIKQSEWLRQHTLTQEQLKQLFENKLKRAKDMHIAFKKQEVLVQGRR